MRGTRATSTGRAVLIGSVACLLAGTLLGYPELQILGATGLLALIVAVLCVVPPLPLVVDRLVEPRRVSRGEPAVGVLSVRHSGRLPIGASVAADRVGDRWVSVDVPRLAPGADRVVRYALPTERRGRFPVGPLVVVRADPLRLLRREVLAGTMEDLWVHPRVFPVGLAPTGLAMDLEGPAADTAPEGTITFRSLREYVIGDDLRRVHWRSSARTGTLMVRQHVDPSRPELTLMLDDRAESYESAESLEQAVDFVASLAVRVRLADFPCRVSAVSGQGVAGGDPSSDQRPLLDGLAELTPAQGPLERMLQHAVARLPGGSAAVLVTGRPSDEDLQRLLGLRRRYGRVLALCVTATALPRTRGLQVLAAPNADLLARRWEREAGR